MVTAPRFVLVLLYAFYLVQVGLLMALLPWSQAWSLLVLRLPPFAAAWLDHPSVKGIVTAFGLLHLLLLAMELRFHQKRNVAAPHRPSSI